MIITTFLIKKIRINYLHKKAVSGKIILYKRTTGSL